VGDVLVVAFVPSVFVIVILIMFTCECCATGLLIKIKKKREVKWTDSPFEDHHWEQTWQG